jgi:pimeloyl-ACP methyl ester carboxylesterase
VIPIAFDGCFGWFHPGETSRAVVLCGPVGEEADYVYAMMREFADELARAGLSTLRFDYPGLYNSLDIDEGRDAPTAWIESIKAAMAWMRMEAGVEDVVLVGLRFGAGLALACAEALGGVDKLVLMAPIVSGVAYQRELALLAKLSEGGKALAGQEGWGQAATLFSAERTFDVESLDCCRGVARPAQSVMILSAGALGAVEKVGQRLRTLGCDVIAKPFHGYADFMKPPEWARYPRQAFDEVLDWLRDIDFGAERAVPVVFPYPEISAQLFPPAAREVAIRFRKDRALVGIQCSPDHPRDGRPAVVFLNTNATPQGGLNRIWVSMARRLATLGFTSLRFDIHGVGDSAPTLIDSRPAPSVREATADVEAAISCVRDMGCTSVCLVGFCWGAQLAYHVALDDDRVTHLVLINSRPTFWDIETKIESLKPFSTYLRLLRDPKKWQSIKRGRPFLPKLVKSAGRVMIAALRAWHRRMVKAEDERKVTTRELRSLKARGIQTFFVHGDDDPFLGEFEDYFGVPRQALGRELGFETCFLAGVSHRFPAEKTLSDLMQVVGDYLAGGVTPTSPAVGAPLA